MEAVTIASKNLHKVNEFQQMLAGTFRVRGLDSHVPESPETGDTFEQNAFQKAQTYGRGVSGWVLADDSGLVVPALGGAPGIFSARYAGKHGDDAANRRKLLQEMQDLNDGDRIASFVCALALWNGDLHQGLVVRGEVSGRILCEERGTGGFGYDALFLLPDAGKTFAELRPEEKNINSHRAAAAAALLRVWRGSWNEILSGQ